SRGFPSAVASSATHRLRVERVQPDGSSRVQLRIPLRLDRTLALRDVAPWLLRMVQPAGDPDDRRMTAASIPEPHLAPRAVRDHVDPRNGLVALAIPDQVGIAARPVRELDLTGRAGRGRHATTVTYLLTRAALAVRQLDLSGRARLAAGAHGRGQAALAIV